jgi:transcriptional regulator GlxA family with amidase domain
MQQNLHRSLSTGELCYYLGISQTHFYRLFAQHIQCSPIRYFLKQKLTYAGHMLRSTSLSIKEIAVIAGYDDPLYFSARFKNQFGISPKNYRQTPLGRSQPKKNVELWADLSNPVFPGRFIPKGLTRV